MPTSATIRSVLSSPIFSAVSLKASSASPYAYCLSNLTSTGLAPVTILSAKAPGQQLMAAAGTEQRRWYAACSLWKLLTESQVVQSNHTLGRCGGGGQQHHSGECKREVGDEHSGSASGDWW